MNSHWLSLVGHFVLHLPADKQPYCALLAWFWLVLLQVAFSSLTFTLLGDPTAVQYFSMDPSTGVITSTRSLQGQDINFNVSQSID